jgi:hypothetical protein
MSNFDLTPVSEALNELSNYAQLVKYRAGRLQESIFGATAVPNDDRAENKIRSYEEDDL